jgi:hypothetical protein
LTESAIAPSKSAFEVCKVFVTSVHNLEKITALSTGRITELSAIPRPYAVFRTVSGGVACGVGVPHPGIAPTRSKSRNPNKGWAGFYSEKSDSHDSAIE